MHASLLLKKRSEKIAAAQEKLDAKGANHLLVTDLAEVAWLLNLRGVRSTRSTPTPTQTNLIHPNLVVTVHTPEYRYINTHAHTHTHMHTDESTLPLPLPLPVCLTRALF